MASSKKPTKPVEKAKSPAKSLPVKQEQFSAKVLGKTIIVTFGKNKATWNKKGITKEEEKKIKDKINLYNKQPKDSTYDAIVKLLQPEKAKKKAEIEKVTAAKKGVKNHLKKTAKRKDQEATPRTLLDELDTLLANDPSAVDKLQALINKYKKVEVAAPVAQVTEKPTRKEVYRNGQRVYIYVDRQGNEVNADGTPLG